MAERTVTREEFIQHIEQLIARQTDEPCTLETPYPVHERSTGKPVGNGTMSFFIEDGWRLAVNDSLRGEHVGVLRLADIMPALDEEQRIAERKGARLRYVIGKKVDPYAMEKRGDHPGLDFEAWYL